MTTDPKSIDPRSLDAEERAIVDRMAFDWQKRDTGLTWAAAYERALFDAKPILSVRRATFAAPQPETVGTVETTADRISADLAAGTFRGVSPKPAPCPTPEAGAASEIPEAITNAARLLRGCSGLRRAEAQPCPGEPAVAADALEAFWRSQPAKPASVGISAEMAKSIDCDLFQIEERMFLSGSREIVQKCREAIRLRASQPVEAKRVRPMPKLTGLLAALRWDLDRFPGQAILHFTDQIDAAERELKELKREGIEG